MGWVIDALQELKSRFKKPKKEVEIMVDGKKKKMPEPPKPPKDLMALTEEEQKVVPKEEQGLYLNMKSLKPEMAAQMLQGYLQDSVNKETEQKEPETAKEEMKEDPKTEEKSVAETEEQPKQDIELTQGEYAILGELQQLRKTMDAIYGRIG